ncbi:MAG TPA: hypothetical protein VFB65_16200 [Pyrinomonadaceae bacterium]|nr:hypothetical protein [Pyrinomonadaceae bacterium]
MSYRGPILIREPELRWPIVVLAAIITAAIAVAAAGIQYFALTQSYLDSHSPPPLEESVRAGNPEFEALREKVLVQHLVGVEKTHPFSDLAIELTATVTNNTGSPITGMELRGAIADSHGSLIRERTVVVVPAKQTVLEPDEAMKVRILIESIDRDSDRRHISLEVTALRFG